MSDSCCSPRRQFDWILWISVFCIVSAYLTHFSGIPTSFSEAIVALVHKMWWGILLGALSVGIIGTIPKEIVMGVLGKGGTFGGLLRATGAGVLLDLCSHGILLVGTKLYERGASLGQVIAFLVASPWNSLSLTLILWSLVGFKWMISILVLSLIVAIISGFIFEKLVASGSLPRNPNAVEADSDFKFGRALKAHLQTIRWSPMQLTSVFATGLKDSRMILRWILFGIVLASLIRTFVSLDLFQTLFGPTLAGLGATLIFATILEVCSEGSLPVATDMLTRAKAPGNAFAFLMAGVSTDYTEILALKETTKSWKIALFLPLVTLPQIIVIGLMLNQI